MENAQDNNSTFQFIGEEKETQNTENKEQSKIDIIKDTEDFVHGLPSWDLNPPYEVIRRVKR